MSQLTRLFLFFSGVPEPCPQAEHHGSLRFTFVPQRDADEPAPQGSRRRRLQKAGGSGSSSSTSSGSGSSASWNSGPNYYGYQLTRGVSPEHSVDTSWKRLQSRGMPRERYMGGHHRNRILGGALLHQVRDPVDLSYCDLPVEGLWGSRLPTAKFSSLGRACSQRRSILDDLKASGAEEMFSVWEEEKKNPVTPFGADPVWMRSSSLFKESMGGSIGDYYNVTPGSPDYNPWNGGAYLHHPAALPGKIDGFPVYFDTALDEARAAELLVYLEDSNFLDGRSSLLTLQMSIYNPQLGTFGYGRVDLVRDKIGVWRLRSSFNSLPPISGWDFNWLLAAVPTLGYLLWLLFATLRTGLTPSALAERLTENAVDAVLVAFMVAAAVISFSSVLAGMWFKAANHYDVYDAQGFAHARYLLPNKAAPDEQNPESPEGVRACLISICFHGFSDANGKTYSCMSSTCLLLPVALYPSASIPYAEVGPYAVQAANRTADWALEPGYPGATHRRRLTAI